MKPTPAWRHAGRRSRSASRASHEYSLCSEAKDDAEAVVEAQDEPQPARRRFAFRRRKADDDAPADPWEA